MQERGAGKWISKNHVPGLLICLPKRLTPVHTRADTMKIAMIYPPKPVWFSFLSATLLTLAAVFPADAQAQSAASPKPPEPVGFLVRTNYHGWENAILVSNGRVEAIIVPQVGRVMQFRFSGQPDGPFWENPNELGKVPDPASTNWVDFGGDKVWPADWQTHLNRTNPPPKGFDGQPHQVSQDGFVITLTSPVDPEYGIQVVRQVQLDLDHPVMHIATTIRKVEGQTIRASIWTATQLKNPVAVYSPFTVDSRFREGFHLFSETRPPGLRQINGLLALNPDPKNPSQIGTDGSSLLWVGEKEALRIDSARYPLRQYPLEGCSVMIETTPGSQARATLSTFSLTRRLRAGDHINEVRAEDTKQRSTPGEEILRTTTYTLIKRTELDPDLEARLVFLK